MTDTDTIFALATPPTASAAAMVRVSGPACAGLWAQLTPSSWERHTARVRLPLAGAPAPCLLLGSPAPASYTGEDTLEIVLPGHGALIAALEDWLTGQHCRRAEPGEFTRRALNNGRVTPTQAAATLGLVSAQSEAERRRALEELSGRAARDAAALAGRLRQVSARYEMLFDFAEEEHADAAEDLLARDLRQLAGELQAFAGGPVAAARTEPVIALFGPPNAGKSSLFNALLGVPRALVSPVPGTTRDAVTATLVLDGRAATLVDLSGVGLQDADAGRFSANARDRALQADVLLVLAAPGQQAEALAELQRLMARDADLPGRALWLDTMSDLDASPPVALPLPRLGLSAASGANLEALRRELSHRVLRASVGGGFSLLRDRVRHAAGTINAALADEEMPPEARAREVRHALTLLDQGLLAELPGDVLDYIFGQFCIGK